MADEKEKQEIEKVEWIIGYILRIGVLVSATIIILGMILMFVQQPVQALMPSKVTFAEILTGVFQLKAEAVMMFGIFCLILTPVLRVVVSIYAFARERDHLYVGITTLVLLILIAGMVLGFVG